MAMRLLLSNNSSLNNNSSSSTVSSNSNSLSSSSSSNDTSSLNSSSITWLTVILVLLEDHLHRNLLRKQRTMETLFCSTVSAISFSLSVYQRWKCLSTLLPYLSVKALYDYTATIDEEFDFQAGDIIAVTSTPEDGWWTGELLDEARRQRGRNVFPSNFVCLF